MKLSEAKSRRDAIAARVLHIDADLLEKKRAYFSEGVQGSMAERVELEAERAKLLVEKHYLNTAIECTKAAQRQYRNTLAHAVLLRMLAERGLGQLAVEADRIAMDQAADEIDPPAQQEKA